MLYLLECLDLTIQDPVHIGGGLDHDTVDEHFLVTALDSREVWDLLWAKGLHGWPLERGA